MKEALLGMFICGLLFVPLIPLLIVALVKKNKTLTRVSVTLLLLVFVGGVTSAVLFLKGAKDMADGRSGDEIYTALFGSPETDCVHTLNYQDQMVPIIDYGIFLDVQTCPQEVRRILAQRPYGVEKQATDPNSYMDNISWLKPSVLGDSIWVLESYNPMGNDQELYLSLDSTRMLCRDLTN